MSECGLDNKGRVALLASVAVNIFLVAFVLGRVGVRDLPPPPFGGPQQVAEDGQPMMPQGDRPMMQRRHDGSGMMRGDGQGLHRGMMRGVPPMAFGPGDLFAPDEMAEDETRMQEHFSKMDALRKDFAAQLQAGPVSKEAVLKHFADIDGIMDTVRKQAQERAANKIASMSEEDRKRFVETLMNREDRPFSRGPRSEQMQPQQAPSAKPNEGK